MKLSKLDDKKMEEQQFSVQRAFSFMIYSVLMRKGWKLITSRDDNKCLYCCFPKQLNIESEYRMMIHIINCTINELEVLVTFQSNVIKIIPLESSMFGTICYLTHSNEQIELKSSKFLVSRKDNIFTQKKRLLTNSVLIEKTKGYCNYIPQTLDETIVYWHWLSGIQLNIISSINYEFIKVKLLPNGIELIMPTQLCIDSYIEIPRKNIEFHEIIFQEIFNSIKNIEFINSVNFIEIKPMKTQLKSALKLKTIQEKSINRNIISTNIRKTETLILKEQKSMKIENISLNNNQSNVKSKEIETTIKQSKIEIPKIIIPQTKEIVKPIKKNVESKTSNLKVTKSKNNIQN